MTMTCSFVGKLGMLSLMIPGPASLASAQDATACPNKRARRSLDIFAVAKPRPIGQTGQVRLRSTRAHGRKSQAVELQQVEHVEVQLVVNALGDDSLEIGEAGHALRPERHEFSVEHGARHAGKGPGDMWQPIGPVQALARKQAHASGMITYRRYTLSPLRRIECCEVGRLEAAVHAWQGILFFRTLHGN